MGERASFSFLTLAVLAGAFFFAFYHLYHVLIPFGLSLALAYILNPVIEIFQLRGLRREFTVLLGYAALALTLTLLANSLIQLASDQLTELQSQGPVYIQRTQRFLGNLELKAARFLPLGSDLVRRQSDKAFLPLLEQAQNIPGYLLGVFPLLSLLFLVPFITFFLLIDGQNTISGMIQFCPSRYVEQVLHLLSEIDSSLGNYLRGLVVAACAIGGASFIGLSFLGLNQALAISILAGVSSFVPYLGAIVGALVGGLAAGFQFGAASAGLKVVLLFALIRLADEALLQPVMARHSVHLHPLVFLLTFMIGGELFGFVGLIFAVPAACVLKALLKVGWAWYSTEAGLEVPQTVESASLPYT